MLPSQAFGFALLATSFMGSYQAELKAGCKVETLRACGEDYVPYGRGPTLPASGKPLADICVTWEQGLNCTYQFYDECLEGVPQVAAFIVIKGLQDNTASVCKVGSERNKEYEKTTPCLNTVGGKLHDCFRNFKVDVNRALAKAAANEVIPHACCSYKDALHCFHEALAPCESIGGKRLFFAFFERALGNAVKLACPDHVAGSEACKSLKKLPPVGPQDRKIESYVEVLTEIASYISGQ